MKPIGQMSMEELAAYVCEALEKEGIETVLSGGCCFKEELIALLVKAREYYSEEEQARLTKQRKRPRRTGKPL